ncbi:MAG: EAL domain-containing protein, partial [Gammaproteobacteria bacterium]
ESEALFDLRRNIILAVGLVVMAFGLLLKLILDRLLTEPFDRMVQTAEAIGNGEEGLRFDEQRSDEFGFLARFINRMLDRQYEQREALRLAAAQLSEEKERAEVTLRAIADGVITTDIRGDIRYMNPVAESLTGWRLFEVEGRPLEEVVELCEEETGEPLVSPVLQTLRTGEPARLHGDGALVRRNGELNPVAATAAVMRDDGGEPMGTVLVLQDVSQNRDLTRQLAYQARHDPLTGLHNRLTFEERLSELVESGSEHLHALMYLDLDQFKVVNDTCGHLAGDQLLRQLADEMAHCLGPHDLLARLGGDEFGVLLHNCSEHTARETAERLQQAVARYRFMWEGRVFQVGVSIGLVFVRPREVHSVTELLRAADLACYTAKDTGRNRIHVYEDSDLELARRHGEMRWVERISRAIDDGRLRLHRQPLQALAQDGAGVRHCEILVRMEGEDGQLIRPDEFLRAAERYNLMGRIDRWVIGHAFAAMARSDLWADCPPLRRRVAINLSGSSLGDPDLHAYILEQQQAHGIHLDEVCFEITETEAISNLGRATEFIQRLRDRGAHFALDDFGTGLSSYAYLKQLPIDYLKIDGGFIRNMLHDEVDQAMVASVVQVAHLMGLTVVAEWVEDAETLALLRELGVDYAQGFHVGRPRPISEPLPDGEMLGNG